MGAAVITTTIKFNFDCVPRTKPIEVITKQSGTAPQRGEPKGSVHNNVSKSMEVKVRI